LVEFILIEKKTKTNNVILENLEL